MAGLVANTVFGVGGGVTNGVQPWNRVSALVDDPSMDVSKQARRGERAGMQLQTVEWRNLNGPKTGVFDLLARQWCTRAPLLASSTKVIV